MAAVLKGRAARKAVMESRMSAGRGGLRIEKAVSGIIEDVRKEGDRALSRYAKKFGDLRIGRFMLSAGEIRMAIRSLGSGAKAVIDAAAESIGSFAEEAAASVLPVRVNRDGYAAGLEWRPVASAGCYVPAGRYPLPSTALMTVLTAKAAGVREISVACPAPGPEIVYAAVLAGACRIYSLGGAQAIAALAFGTRTVKAVDVIAGPGNAYVTEAKRQVQGIVGIDMLAGPSEVAIIADAGANPEWAALDALAQLEHDPDARAWVLTDDAGAACRIASAMDRLASAEGAPDFLEKSAGSAKVLAFGSLDECAWAADEIAPEHLELLVSEPEELKAKVGNYGALFMGYAACVPYGDYMAGPNHTLPTGRTARFAGGLTPVTFMRVQSYVEALGGIGGLARRTADFAAIEGLSMHKAAAEARIGRCKQSTVSRKTVDRKP